MIDPGFEALRTPRLVVRRFCGADAAELAAYRSDPEVARYQAWESCTVEEAERFVASLAALAPGTPGHWFQFAVARARDGALVGDCALRCPEAGPDHAELGFTFARAQQGRGYAGEAVTALLDYALRTLALRRVFAITDARNARARRLLERLGFRCEGTLPEAAWFKGEWASEVRYAVALPDEGRARGARPQPRGSARPVIQPAGPDDLPFLREMLVRAAWWRPDAAPPDVESALRRPDLAPLLAGWGRAGDTGAVAWRGSERLGAAWYRTWTAEQHSYGFVDAGTPELGVAVRPDARGAGVGRALLEALAARAREQGFAQLSLSVEADNPARRLYERLGFRPVARVGGAWTLVLRLDA